MAVKVNTNAVRYAADRINSANQVIETSFDNVDRAITMLSKNWKGTAGECAVRSLRGTKNRYQCDRYESMKRLADFMNERIADRYDQTERKRSAAASAFK